MGIYVNPGNQLFKEAVNSQIYVDKSELLNYTNKVLKTQRKNICVSRPRRFGKSMAADMLVAYYSKGCNSKEVFAGLKVSQENRDNSVPNREEAGRLELYEANLNCHNVVRFDVQRFLFDESHVHIFIKRIQDVIVRELRDEFGGWGNLMEAFNRSEELLKNTWAMKADEVAKGIGQARKDMSSIIQYNNENSMACSLYAAYASARAYYMKPLREFPGGRGFADIVYLPLRDTDRPALLIELKWDKSAKGAIGQIKDKQYADWVREYTGDILLVAIYLKGGRIQ